MDLEINENPFGGFPEQVQLDVEGLTFLGYLQEEVEWCGHTFILRTLRATDELQAALLSKEYLETPGQWLAYGAANVALSLVSIDGNPNFAIPLGPSDKNNARTRFDVVIGWYRPTVEFLLEQYESLKERQQKAIEAVRDLSLRGRMNSWASPDSFTVQADFPNPIEDIQELLTD